MKLVKSLILLFLFASTSANIMSQGVEISASIDSSSIRIGEQRSIHLELSQPQSVTVQFPNFNLSDTLVKGIEIISISKLDTTTESNSKLKITQDIVITSFDTGHYTIPPFQFLTKVKRMETEKLFLTVSTIEDDFEHAQVKGIQENYDPSFNWTRLFLYLSILLILACIGFIAYLVYNYYLRQKAEKEGVSIVVDTRLPHEIALQELDVIKEKKVWKQGFTKQYYSNITDTLREYFVKRFNISAMEMTSSEILDNLKYNNEASEVIDSMRQIFSTSDMVKFAKQEPTQEENELSILNAYRIVNQTTIIPTEEKTEEESAQNSVISNEEKNS